MAGSVKLSDKFFLIVGKRQLHGFKSVDLEVNNGL